MCSFAVRIQELLMLSFSEERVPASVSRSGCSEGIAPKSRGLAVKLSRDREGMRSARPLSALPRFISNCIRPTPGFGELTGCRRGLNLRFAMQFV
jgi:hypothetical protein